MAPRSGLIEESQRYCPSANLSMPLTATADVRLGGTLIRAGELVAAALPLANRDAAVFADQELRWSISPTIRCLSAPAVSLA